VFTPEHDYLIPASPRNDFFSGSQLRPRVQHDATAGGRPRAQPRAGRPEGNQRRTAPPAAGICSRLSGGVHAVLKQEVPQPGTTGSERELDAVDTKVASCFDVISAIIEK